MGTTHQEDPKDWKFKRTRTQRDHIDNCTDGYCEPKGRVPNVLEIHHALCVHACSDATLPKNLSDDELEYIRSCLAITVWDIDAAANTIGLPRKWAYVKDVENATGWNGYPCHQVDHDLYLEAVELYVTDNIWNPLKKAKKKKKCESVTSASVVALFNAGSKQWKGFLTARGNEYGGTKRCLDYCLKDQRDPILESCWHIPFSMSPGAARRRAKPKAKTTLQRLGLLIQLIV
jgi:hypothetical protein